MGCLVAPMPKVLLRPIVGPSMKSEIKSLAEMSEVSLLVFDGNACLFT